MRALLVTCSILLVAFSTTASSEPDLELLERLEKARTLWAEHGTVSYSYTIRRGGVFGSIGKVKVKVSNGSCTSATYWRRLLRRKDSCSGKTVAELFDEIEGELADGFLIEVEFDPEIGVPLELSATGTIMEDQDFYYEITRFRQ